MSLCLRFRLIADEVMSERAMQLAYCFGSTTRLPCSRVQRGTESVTVMISTRRARTSVPDVGHHEDRGIPNLYARAFNGRHRTCCKSPFDTCCIDMETMLDLPARITAISASCLHGYNRGEQIRSISRMRSRSSAFPKRGSTMTGNLVMIDLSTLAPREPKSSRATAPLDAP